MNIYELIDRITLEHKTIFDMPLRVTFYARVSTKKDEQLNSQENQVQTFTELIQNNMHWTLVDGYVDTIRGESAANRDNFKRMIADAKSGMFDLIVCKEISRFSRDLLDSISYTRELFKNNVGVYFTSDNLCTIDRDSELRLGIMASIAQEEVSRLSTRIKFGHKKAIESGTVMGNSRIYGYIKKDRKLVLDEQEAVMIRMIFELYSTGDYSLHDLSDILYKKDFKNHNGNPISHTTIKTIIKNPKYKGYYCGNKVKILDYRTKKQKFLNPDEWVMYKDETGEIVPAIVSEELWETCNQMLEKRCVNKGVGNDGGKRFTSSLSGKIKCYHCGVSYHHDSYGHQHWDEVRWHWRCSNKKKRSSNCPSFSINDNEMIEIIRAFFTSFIKNMDEYIDQYLEVYTKTSESGFTRSVTDIDDDIKKIERKQEKLLDLYSDDLISKSEYKTRHDKLQDQMSVLYEEKAEKSSERSKLKNKIEQLNKIKSYFNDREVTTLSDSLIYELSKPLINQIVIKTVDDTRADIYIIPELGNGSNISFQKGKGLLTIGDISKKMIESYENSAQ